MPQFPKQSTRPLTTAGYRARAQSIAKFCRLIDDYAFCLDQLQLDAATQAETEHQLDETVRRLTDACLDLSRVHCERLAKPRPQRAHATT